MHRVGEKRCWAGSDSAVFGESPPTKKRRHLRAHTSRPLSRQTPSRLYILYRRVAHWIMNAFSSEAARKDPGSVSESIEQDCAGPTSPVPADRSFSVPTDTSFGSIASEIEGKSSHGLLQHKPGRDLSEDVIHSDTMDVSRCTEERDFNRHVISKYFTSTPRQGDIDSRLVQDQAQEGHLPSSVLSHSTHKKTVSHSEIGLSHVPMSTFQQSGTDTVDTHSSIPDKLRKPSDSKEVHPITLSFQPVTSSIQPPGNILNSLSVHSSVAFTSHSNSKPHFQNGRAPTLWSQCSSPQPLPTHSRIGSRHTSDPISTSFKKSCSVISHLSNLSSTNHSPVVASASPLMLSERNALHSASASNDKSTSLLSEQSMSRRKDLDSLLSYIQQIQAEHKHSQEDSQMLLELARTKLLLCQEERQAVEDDMMSRIRLGLEDSHIQEDTQTAPPWALQDDQTNQVASAMSGNNMAECLSERYRIRICRSDLCTLEPTAWLNDEVMNFYFNMVQECCNQSQNIKVHIFNSFFYLKLTQSGYGGVRRWTKKVDLFSCDIVLLPVHLGMHWCLAVVDMKSKQLIYYDSLLGNNVTCLQRLREYLTSESLDKRKAPLDLSAWTDIIPKDIPRQKNSWDCGVFTCMYARFKALNQPFTFSQGDMPNIRKMMVFEILQQKLFLQ